MCCDCIESVEHYFLKCTSYNIVREEFLNLIYNLCGRLSQELAMQVNTNTKSKLIELLLYGITKETYLCLPNRKDEICVFNNSILMLVLKYMYDSKRFMSNFD